MLWNITQEMSDIRIKEVHGLQISNTHAILENVKCKIMTTTAINTKITYAHGKILNTGFKDYLQGYVTN
jgi:hypothetical protein